MILIREDRIEVLRQSLASIKLPVDFQQRFVPALHTDQETAYLALLWVAAICHSTKGGLLGTINGREVKGTEYLLAAFCAAANSDSESVSVRRIMVMDEDGLRSLLVKPFVASTVVLTDLARRAEMLRVLATEIAEKFAGKIGVLLIQTDHHVGGSEGFYAKMDQFSAFRDPLKKKSGVFLYFLEVAGLWKIVDHDQLMPMIDYHVIRLLCRTGCLEIQDPNLRHKLLAQSPVTEEEERMIREAAFKVRISLTPLFDVPERGELLYLLGRSYCRHAPVCVSGNAPENDSFNLYTGEVFKGCPFQFWCPGACDSSYRELWEPMIQTEHY
jgi:hypothetical protein